MFTWICPQCGREVPPAYNECPDCSAKAAAGAPPPADTAGGPVGPAAPPPADTAGSPVSLTAPPQAPMEPAPAPAYAPPQAPQPAYRPQQAMSPMFQAPPPQAPQYAPQRPGGIRLPTWLLAVLFALAIGGVGAGAVWLFTGHSPQRTSVIETPPSKDSPVQKDIEVAGVRFAPVAKGVAVSFVLINHSASDLVGLAGNVKLYGQAQKKDDPPMGDRKSVV